MISAFYIAWLGEIAINLLFESVFNNFVSKASFVQGERFSSIVIKNEISNEVEKVFEDVFIRWVGSTKVIMEHKGVDVMGKTYRQLSMIKLSEIKIDGVTR